MHNLGPELEPLLAYFSQIESQLKGSIFVSNIVSNAAVTKHRQKRQCGGAEAPPHCVLMNYLVTRIIDYLVDQTPVQSIPKFVSNRRCPPAASGNSPTPPRSLYESM